MVIPLGRSFAWRGEMAMKYCMNDTPAMNMYDTKRGVWVKWGVGLSKERAACRNQLHTSHAR